MHPSLEFILGRLDRSAPAYVDAEDLRGAHARALKLFQQQGFLARESEWNHRRPCPCCFHGAAYQFQGRWLCSACGGTIPERSLYLWRFNLEAFLRRLARGLGLRAHVRQIDASLWDLGELPGGASPLTCFYRRGESLGEQARQRLQAFRQAVLLHGVPPVPADDVPGRHICLADILDLRHALVIPRLADVLRRNGPVRFDEGSGVLWEGDRPLGEVPVLSREYFFLLCLAWQPDRTVTYTTIREFVLARTGGADTRDEATFCQQLKSRVKRKYIPEIDQVVRTSIKEYGYRLRAAARTVRVRQEA
jgi:hypothetical protein